MKYTPLFIAISFCMQGISTNLYAETDNLADLDISEPNMPDLVITKIDVPDQIVAGEKFRLSYEIANRGGEGPERILNFGNVCYLVKNDKNKKFTFDKNVIVLDYRASSHRITADFVREMKDSVMIETDKVPPGDYFIVAMVDCSDEPGDVNGYPGVAESDEENNSLAVPVTVVAGK